MTLLLQISTELLTGPGEPDGDGVLPQAQIGGDLPDTVAEPVAAQEYNPVFLWERGKKTVDGAAQLPCNRFLLQSRGGNTVTFAIVLGGFLLLGVRQKLLMALVTALVDAVPLLGTGTILLPWTLVSLLSGEPVRAVGLLGIYVTALITRSALEPRLLGRQLGLDPLAALAALYIGYRIWGFGGMILAPILTVTAKELCRGNS